MWATKFGGQACGRCFTILIGSCGIIVSCLYDTKYRNDALIYSGIAVAGFVCTMCLIPHFSIKLIKRGISGVDMAKTQKDFKIPESLGIVCVSVFTVLLLCYQSIWHPSKVLQYNTVLFSAIFMVFMGFVDDVLDLRWRYKMFLPILASLPLVCSYSGPTDVTIPNFYNNEAILVNLGIFYYIYMSLLTVICTNSINIYAGLNGLEAGQCGIISATMIVYNLIEMKTNSPHCDESSTALLLSLTFLGCCLGLLSHNWYPSQVFVGDSFTYAAGMILVATGITGRFSKVLILFFIPQIINLIISTPQLLGILPCPKHRLPRYDENSGCVYSSENLTLINMILTITGPMKEKKLVELLLLIQCVSCSIALIIRYSKTFEFIFM